MLGAQNSQAVLAALVTSVYHSVIKATNTSRTAAATGIWQNFHIGAGARGTTGSLGPWMLLHAGDATNPRLWSTHPEQTQPAWCVGVKEGKECSKILL